MSISFLLVYFSKKKDKKEGFIPENEFGNQLFLDPRFLVDFSTF